MCGGGKREADMERRKKGREEWREQARKGIKGRIGKVKETRRKMDISIYISI